MGLQSYATRHAQALVGSLGRLVRSPFATALTVLVIALALALPLGLKLLVANATVATGGFSNAIDLSVYFKAGVPLSKVQQLAASARGRAGIAQVTVVSADDALKEFRDSSGFGAALQALQQNPLPHALHVRPDADATSAASLEALRHYFADWPEVDVVQMDTEWVLRFNAILNVLQRVLLVTAVVLAVGAVAAIGNTVRLEIHQRRSEIEVTKLVGGSNGFIRRPFLYTGVLYGLSGALLAWLVTSLAVMALARPVAALAALYGSRWTLAGPTWQDVGVLLGVGVIIGWLGAFIAATRHLRRIEPRA
jgi:cell division transport system permease protein